MRRKEEESIKEEEMEGIGSKGGDRRRRWRRWVVEKIEGGSEKIGGGDCL